MIKNKLIFNVLIPLLFPAAFFMVAAITVELLGCRIKAAPESGRWMITTIILALPAFYIALFET